MVVMYTIIGVVVLIFIFSGKLRVLAKGFVNIFIEDLAKTPEGVAAIYSEAINECQKNYNEARDTFKSISGQLETLRNKKSETVKTIAELERKCVALAKTNEFDKVELFAVQRESLTEDLESIENSIAKLEIAYLDAKELNCNFEKELILLKSKKTKVITELKLNNDMNKMYDRLDGLKKVSGTDKLLDVVDTSLQESRSMAIGAKEIYNNKLSTKLNRAELSAKKAMTSSYVEYLKEQYGKNSDEEKTPMR